MDLTRRVQNLEKTVESLRTMIQQSEGPLHSDNNVGRATLGENDWQTSLTHLRLNITPAPSVVPVVHPVTQHDSRTMHLDSAQNADLVANPSHRRNRGRKPKKNKGIDRNSARMVSEFVSQADLRGGAGAYDDGNAEIVQ